MSGKLIMKRKREERGRQHAGSTEPLEPAEPRQLECKRERLEPPLAEGAPVPPPAPAEAPVSQTRNKILLEALQKIVELQNELDDFEHDLDENDEYLADYGEDSEVSFYLDEDRQQQELHRRHEAEALGFAMCARETLLFLQREGIPSDSLVYRALREKLTGQTDGVIPI